jgi:hypothetical protein
MKTQTTIIVAAMAFSATTLASAGVESFSASGDAAAIQATVDQFRSTLGQLNGNVPGSFGSGRREINWDAVPDTFSSPNVFPGNFFNFTTAPRARGALFTVAASGHFEVSAKDVNPTSTPVEFGNIDTNYVEAFGVFSPQRLFSPVGETLTVVEFFIPGTVTVPAGVTGFGAVFTDVDVAGSTKLTAFDSEGNVLASVEAPPAAGNGLFSFAAITSTGFEDRIAKVEIVSGNLPLGLGNLDNARTGADVVAMDDFIYGEPTNLNCQGDLNGDSEVGAADLAILLGAWGPVGANPADFNGDGEVAGWDLAWLLGIWGPCGG